MSAHMTEVSDKEASADWIGEWPTSAGLAKMQACKEDTRAGTARMAVHRATLSPAAAHTAARQGTWAPVAVHTAVRWVCPPR